MFEWLFYNTFIPLLPVPLVMLGSWMKGANRHVFSVIRDGQLCFYCTALSAVAIKDILASSSAGLVLIRLPIGGMIFCMILSTFAYGIAVTSDDAEDNKLGIISLLASLTTTVLVVTTRKSIGLL